MMIALLLVLMAGSVGVSADGSDPLDPSDGGADWDGDGLTNAEETAEGTDPTNPTPIMTVYRTVGRLHTD